MLFKKYANNPVFGGKETGTTFDAYVSKQDKMLRMDFSYRAKKSCAVVFSSDGINWNEPVITLSPNPESGWENDINRNCVLYVDGIYKMWYTGQADGHSRIGYAESVNGLGFVRKQSEPVIDFELPWEGESVMNPCVIYENGLYRMWYSAGETYEPNVIAYAESSNGIDWKKHKNNPIFKCEKKNFFEQDRIGGCDIIKADGRYIMFYIGYENIDTARICAACSADGIGGWERSRHNPLIEPDEGKWDGEACYKPTVIWDDNLKKWRLWYNGRTKADEFIGLAECDKRNLF